MSVAQSLLDSGRLFGTSSCSTVAAQIASGASLLDLYYVHRGGK